MKNIWQILCNEEIKRLMTLCGVKEKYIDGDASDYEKMCAFCACAHLLSGNREAERLTGEISKLVRMNLTVSDLGKYNTSELWNRSNSCLYPSGMTFDICDEKLYCNATDIFVNKCDEKINIFENINDLNSMLIRAKNEKITDIEELIDSRYFQAKMPFYVRFGEDDFERPNRYAVNRELNKLCIGEKYNKNLILSQMLFEILYKNKCCNLQLVLIVKSNMDYIEGFIKYMNFRGLSARMYIYTDIDTQPQIIKKLCLLSKEKCYITPIVVKGKADEGGFNEYLGKLSAVYPIGRADVI